MGGPRIKPRASRLATKGMSYWTSNGLNEQEQTHTHRSRSPRNDVDSNLRVAFRENVHNALKDGGL